MLTKMKVVDQARGGCQMEKWKEEVINSCDDGTTFFMTGNDLRTGSETPLGGITKEIDISVQ